MLAVQNAIEDVNGDVDRLALYNCDPNLKPQQLLPKGTVFAIKEPFYKGTADGGYSIRIDHPSDLVQFQPTDASIPSSLAPRIVSLDTSATDWKKDGNAAYVKKEYLTALQMYTCGIETCEDKDAMLKFDLFRNRSIVNLSLKRYEAAEADARASIIPALDVTESKKIEYNTKALYRAGRAAYELGNFQQAKDDFEGALKLTPNDIDALREQERVTKHLPESMSGAFDMDQMSKSASKRLNRLDHASFTCNVEVRDAGKRGRGLFATKDIKAGELIFCEKAFDVAFISDNTTEVYMIINLNTNRGAMGPHATLLFSVVQKLRHNPLQAARFLDLYDGGYTPKCTAPFVDNATVIDTFQVQAILEHNGFGCADVRSVDEANEPKSKQEGFGSVGVWITASYCNHACDGNAHRSFIGDMMIVHAGRNIGKSEEITMAYRAPEPNNKKTIEHLQKAWGFHCDCVICVAEGKTPVDQRKERQKLLEEVSSLLSAHKQTLQYFPNRATISKAEKLYGLLEGTYDKRVFQDVPRLGLVDIGIWLCQAFSTSSTPQKAINIAIRVLQDLGFDITIRGTSVAVNRRGVVNTEAVDAAVYASHSHLYLKNNQTAKQLEDLAKEMYRTLHGELRGFKDRYEKAA